MPTIEWVSNKVDSQFSEGYGQWQNGRRCQKIRHLQRERVWSPSAEGESENDLWPQICNGYGLSCSAPRNLCHIPRKSPFLIWGSHTGFP
jgi:hypothetical protein